jgi:acyl-CoA dehydrogenase
LASWYGAQRTLRFADGPDAVHRMVIGRRELREYNK